MKILLVSTAHNSLSQRIYLALVQHHTVTVEYALSDDVIREAVSLAEPDLIICPFLTARIPTDIYEHYLTLIIHPGPPGDAGPSSLDWVLMGDDGSESDPEQLLKRHVLSEKGRTHWGVTVLQAEAEFDAGPVWAFEQFPLNIDEPGLTKSGLYRGAVTRAAVAACLAAVERIQTAAFTSAPVTPPLTPGQSQCPSPVYRAIHPGLKTNLEYQKLSVGIQELFLGGVTHHRPLLKAGQRDFSITDHNAHEVSRRIRASDSQPGCLSAVLGHKMYIYGGIIEEGDWASTTDAAPGTIIAVRDEAVCIKTSDQRGVWITHVRAVKKKTDAKLWPKVPAVSGLREVGLLSDETISKVSRPYATAGWAKSAHSTFQEVWVDFTPAGEDKTARVAYVYANFYNGAMSTSQCSKLIDALDFVLNTHTPEQPLAAVALLGGDGYFSNGVHLNVIEAAKDPALESWDNINRIDDVVYYLLHEFPSRNIRAIAGVRGNAAAGGVALATACDLVVAGADVVLNPAYRGLGLYGSEYHSVSYNARAGPAGARSILRDMTPISAHDGQALGIVDHVLPGYGAELDASIRKQVQTIIEQPYAPGAWKANADVTTRGLLRARAAELGEMGRDFWSPRSERYHTRRGAFVRKTKAAATPLRFAKHRRGEGEKRKLDEEETEEYDSVHYFAVKQAQELQANIAKALASKAAEHVTGEVAPTVSGEAPVKALGQGPIFACYYGA
ncbi:hypothetical protein VPNG_03415 [Cytospora leucostoma]|uniref:Formyl transferase C-terminal domain-containing protein n=1 Tax=Cytospora leucostoma TaxID=1230097 RepID=A0A423XFY7_9PEZI|nr:hypothetical protein VPNG_03415 [Cytospora leucostoma]